jgi:hypothetical protein
MEGRPQAGPQNGLHHGGFKVHPAFRYLEVFTANAFIFLESIQHGIRSTRP